ncbi:PAS domain S-box protein [Methanolobus mangrovi]|uniref:histidine kinase n=1 Tax=Methanolobus mangrovi TaxID=3072977 RepID=A0AA51YK35_9EURY|nr:PAS domain S-box protein [Methanolobus mangrovi]WMW22789.1 PAS domain S-box protein [Methanolobus mangrovi]
MNSSDKGKNLALKVTALYILVASIWILCSDIVLGWFALDVDQYMQLQTYKGWFFVLITGSLLFTYLTPRIRELNRSRKSLQDTEESLNRRLDYEMATVRCMRLLLEPANMDKLIPQILDIIHQTVGNSRTYIFKNEENPELGLCMSQVYEVVSDGIEPQIDNPDLQHLPYNEGAPTMLPILESRQHFVHVVEELEEPERTILAEQGILSILIIPIFTGKELWGFIGFDDCAETRKWHEDDINLLEVIADGIGEYIFHRKAENDLKESEERFKALHNASFGGIAIHDKGLVLDCNQGLSEITGYTTNELIGMDGLLLIEESFRSRVIDNMISGYEEAYEVIGCRKDGTEYPVRVQAKIVPYKGKQLRVTEFRDITEQKEAEEALKKSEAKQSAMIANISDVIAVIDKDGINRYKSPNIEKWFGWKPEEMIGVSTWENIHPDDLEQTQKLFSRLLEQQNATSTSEARYCCKDGSYKWMEFTAINLLHEPTINGILLNYHDITERKQAENHLRESEAKESAMIANSADVIAIVDRDGINIYKSPNIEKWFGWKPEEMIGVSAWKNIHPDDLKNTQELYPIFLEMPEAVVTSEARYRCKDDSYKWIEFTISNLLNEPAINGVMLNYHDITERKIAENALRDSESKFRNYIENAPYAIFIADEDWKYLEVNKTASMLTGYSEEELLTMTGFDLVAPESQRKAYQSNYEVKNTGFTTVELLFIHKDKTSYWMRMDATKLSENRYIVFASDITERKRAEYSLIEGKILAEENNRIKSEFLANMSHELRTPLTAIIGFSDILDAKLFGELNEKQISHVNHINKSGRHLLEVINDILDLSKIEAGKMELDCENFPISNTLNEIQAFMHPMAGKKNIDLKIINEIKDVEIFADRVKFKQIMFNLLSNAIKFTPDNGKVSVFATNTEDDIQVSVSDTGIGIPLNLQQDIFNPFTQVDSSNKRRYGGTGLGLALVKQFVELHNGKIWLESEEGKGSTFSFTIKNQDSLVNN